MNHSEVVQLLSDRLNISQKKSGNLLKKLVGRFKELLGNNTGYTIPGLGTFSTKLRDRRKSFIPSYNKEMVLPPKRSVSYHPNVNLKEEVKDVEVE